MRMHFVIRKGQSMSYTHCIGIYMAKEAAIIMLLLSLLSHYLDLIFIKTVMFNRLDEQ